ncbi:MAG: hypothetical protein HQM00_12370 [Magnetococcales bacterium]|nr:hypothetical protein [Magnetococcales bacterium]
MHRDSFRVVLIAPPDYAHAEALREMVETVHYGLLALGHPSTIALNDPDPNARNILLGGNLMPRSWLERVPPGSILYNLEQWDSSWVRGILPELMARCETWDYDAHNLEQLRQAGLVQRSRHVPVGYVPELQRIPRNPETIDVLFYGSLNERRQRVLHALEQQGVAVQMLFGQYGARRDEAISRAKLILNIHYYDTKIFEIARISYLLTNAKAVVTEMDAETRIDPELRDGLLAVPYEGLVEACMSLLHDDTRRHALGRTGQQRFAQRPETEILRRALTPEAPAILSSTPSLSPTDRPAPGALSMAQPPGYPPLPRILNIGSGKNFREECLNLDLHDGWKPDLLGDLNDPLPGPNPPLQPTRRFGPIRLEPGQFDQILAFDVLEHVRDLITAMTSCRDLLRIGGTLHVVVPYDLSFGAWQDPTHIRAFNERSWLYYTDWFWYLGWTETRFALRQLNYTLSPLGMELQQQGEPADRITRTPRAVDSLDVILEKIPLTPEDLHALELFRPKG